MYTEVSRYTMAVTRIFLKWKERKEMFYLTTHSTHFIYGYMASDIWLRTILIVRKETCCRHIGYSYRLTARVLLYTPSLRQDSTYHGLCYTSRGALAKTKREEIKSCETLLSICKWLRGTRYSRIRPHGDVMWLIICCVQEGRKCFI